MKSVKGVLISGVKPGSKGFKAGIYPGEILLKIDSIEVDDLDDFKKKYENYKTQPEKSFLLFLSSGRSNNFALIEKE